MCMVMSWISIKGVIMKPIQLNANTEKLKKFLKEYNFGYYRTAFTDLEIESKHIVESTKTKEYDFYFYIDYKAGGNALLVDLEEEKQNGRDMKEILENFIEGL